MKALDAAVTVESRAKVIADALKKRMSKKGALGLPKLLDERRLEYGLPDAMFQTATLFDRIYVYQIANSDRETYGDTSIIMPKTVQSRIEAETPRGILVSAGATALDHLRSNGVDLGHIVRFIKNAPWKMDVDTIEGHVFSVLVMRDGDLTGSEDLQAALKAGKCKLEVREIGTNGKTEVKHVYVDKSGQVWDPQIPWIADDL